jgi:hypothetical protein
MEKKSGGNGQVLQATARLIWIVKQHWARKFDPARAKILIFKKILLQKWSKNFLTCLNLLDQMGGASDHLAIVPNFFPIGSENGLRCMCFALDFGT